ncbi:DUF2730 family protein [Methylopila sp. M107]|uniref:DUF2730 family protein n=1 Tax=Methylopila sp. M107 TaxID=1101190 RepID=UPI000381C90B|nr:DUF2730 family protein [Methylopila sp. M107]
MTAAEITTIDADFGVIAFVLFIVFAFLFLGIWGVAQKSASKADVGNLEVKVALLESKMDTTDKRVVDVERAISHLPTKDHVHAIEVRVERIATALESVVRQTHLIYEFQMSEAKKRDEATT